MQIISILTICNTPVRAAVVAHALRLECRGPNPARVSSRELQPLLVHGHGHRVVFIFGKLRLQLRKHLFLFFPHVLFEERAELAQFSCPVSAMLVAAQIEEILLPKTVVMVEGLRSRSEERRVGKEWVRKCRFRGSTYH